MPIAWVGIALAGLICPMAACGQCSTANPNGCYAATTEDFVGCNNISCCQSVCDHQSSCCDAQWSLSCAVEAAQRCGGCGPGNENDCIAATVNETTGCNDTLCCQQVCGFDSYCCDVRWDEACAAEAGLFCLPPPNDSLTDPTAIFDGITPFETIGATTDGPMHYYCEQQGNQPILRDVWFQYTSTCSGRFFARTCGSFFDTNLAFYQVSQEPFLLACNDSFCGTNALLFASVSEGQHYLLRAGSGNGSTGFGILDIACVSSCPKTDILESSPWSGTIDAREPVPPFAANPSGLGIGDEVIRIQLPENLINVSNCFRLCETSHDGLLPNDIAQAEHAGAGLYVITLRRAISPAAVTTITYAGASTISLISHPGNVNGDGITDVRDVLFLIDVLNDAATAPFGLLSTDINHNGAANLPDILRLIDMMNGVLTDRVWNGFMITDTLDCP